MERHDELQDLITQRLGERARKMQRIEEWEEADSASAQPPLWTWRGKSLLVYAAAACIVAALLVVPMLRPAKVTAPADDTWRGAADSTTEQLLQAGNYEAALSRTDSLIIVTQQAIQLLQQAPQDDETAYELQAEQLKLEDLETLREKISKKME